MEEVSMLSLRKGGIEKQCCSSNNAWTRSTESSATVSSTSSPAARSDLKQVSLDFAPSPTPFPPHQYGCQKQAKLAFPRNHLFSRGLVAL